MKTICVLAALCVVVLGSTRAAETVQVDVHEVLNTRVFTTLTNGKIVPLKDDIDGAGGLATAAAAAFLKNKDPRPLPDVSKIAATDKHPEFVLNYSNDDGEHNQARRCRGEDTFTFAVPPKNYARLFMYLSSGQGASKIKVDFTYKDGTTETRDIEVPDWYVILKKDDVDRVYVVTDLGKWNKQNAMVEASHHSIFGLDVKPSADKVLTSVKVTKSKAGIMVFYGATGQVKE